MNGTGLWKFGGHQMHHSAESLDAFGAHYLHPIDAAMFTTFGSIVFIPILGLSVESAILGALFLTFNGMFQHANIATPHWLGYVIQRPESPQPASWRGHPPLQLCGPADHRHAVRYVPKSTQTRSHGLRFLSGRFEPDTGDADRSRRFDAERRDQVTRTDRPGLRVIKNRVRSADLARFAFSPRRRPSV